MILLYFFFLLPVLTAVVHLLSTRPKRLVEIIELVLGHVIFWGIGIGGIAGFVILTVPEMATWVTQEWIGWAAGNPSQDILAWAYLGVGIAGLIAFWFKGGFRVATVLIAVLMAVGEFIAIASHGVPDSVLSYAIVYDLVGSGILVFLLGALYVFGGRKVFWDCHGCKATSGAPSKK